jgi:hypothetical protein
MSLKRKIIVRKMKQSDIPSVAKIYKEVSVNKHNYKKMLLTRGDAKYSSCGGMFIIQSEKEIAKLLDNGEKFYVGISGDKIQGFLWSRLVNCSLDYYEDILYDDDSLKDYVLNAKRNNSIIHGGEVAVSKTNPYSSLATAFMHLYLTHRYTNGYRSATGEVYRVTRCIEDSEESSIDVFNKRSYNLQIKTGASVIGKAPKIVIDADCFSVEITPTIVMWNISDGIKKIESILDKDQIVFEGVL